ncbi:phage tail tape measure protein [Shewanella sp. GutDb-MelDb]|uniref:phage tail tape measure protein n=1 Tax=Shewanella sp. GutDb-MelDb TaxID=2058316 RepID=UPI000C7E6BE3|nr:phage tail tape measure protein [Shewanella sp. GutDb-MelDb]PKG57740.1 phage tail tape measure protein [Shewanella sp. GutDb-MelDb]
MSLPKPLMFTVGLVDQITKPIAKITQQFSGLAANYQAGTMQMATGIGGIAASGYALQNALMPAIEMDRALGEVKSLGVRQSALKQLTDTSYEYALKYGKSATDFISSSYDIQSAIEGLSDSDLSQFTLASNVLASATKADAATITSYMGTMYGIFKNDANAMGKGDWVNQVTGMTATAVQAFKTTGAEMSSAFTAIGAEAQSAGVGMHEQMAILGTLQATMSGSESGTKYKAFLAGVGKAQKGLNLQFTDAQGAMLPMVDILNKIKGKYGETLDVAEGDALAKAFGSQEAVATVKLLMGNIDGLAGSINKLGDVKGMGQAEVMAAAMTDQSERLAQSWYVIRAAFGSAVLPAFNQFVGWIADMGKQVLWFTQTFPNLTRVLGYGAIALLGLVAAGGAFTVMMGVGKMAMTTYGVAAMAWAGINTLLTSGLASLRGIMLAVNIAMYANPVGLVVAGIAALIAVVGLAVYYFDDLRAMMVGTAWGEPILYAVDAIAGLLKTLGGIVMSVFGGFFSIVATVFNALKPLASFLLDVVVFNLKIMGGVWAAVFGAIAYGIGGLVNIVNWVVTGIVDCFTWAFDSVGAAWNGLVSWFTNDAWVQYLVGKAVDVGSFFSSMWDDIKAKFAETWGWIADKLNMLPGIDIDVTPIMGDVAAPAIQSTIPEVLKNHNQQAVPTWMQQSAANDVPNAAPMTGPWLDAPTNIQTVEMQRNLAAPYQPEAVTQQQHVQLVPPSPLVPDVLNQSIDVQRNLPAPYQPEALAQQQHVQLVQPSPLVPDVLNQSIDMQRNLPVSYQPEAVTQQQHVQLVQPSPLVPDVLNQSIDVQRNLPAPYQPEAVTPQFNSQPTSNEMVTNVIKPRINKQAAMSAQANRVASQSNSKSLTFGDVIIKHPPKNFSLAELAEQQELMTG